MFINSFLVFRALEREEALKKECEAKSAELTRRLVASDKLISDLNKEKSDAEISFKANLQSLSDEIKYLKHQIKTKSDLESMTVDSKIGEQLDNESIFEYLKSSLYLVSVTKQISTQLLNGIAMEVSYSASEGESLQATNINQLFEVMEPFLFFVLFIGKVRN